MMRVSIILPVLNEADSIGTALAALRPLREAGVEVVVVDGGSIDNSFALAVPHADLVLLAPCGRGRQLQAGAAAAQGDVLLFLHADTRLPAGALAAMQAALADGSRQWGRFDVMIAGKSPLLPVVARMMNLRSRLTGIATGDQAIFATRRAYEACGGFPDQALMEDIEGAKRLRRISRPACLRLRVTTSGRRWDANGALRTIGLMWSLRLLYWLGISPARLARIYGYGS